MDPNSTGYEKDRVYGNLFNWWLVRVTLVVAWRLFTPQILGGGRDLQIVILLKKEYNFSGGDMWGGEDTQPLQDA